MDLRTHGTSPRQTPAGFFAIGSSEKKKERPGSPAAPR
jgi:hypothetical protein